MHISISPLPNPYVRRMIGVMITNKHLIATLGLAAALFATVPAAAQDDSDSPYARCATIAEDMARLACFDETFANEGARRAEQEAAERKETVENFGLSALQIEERRAASGEPTTLTENGQISASVVDIYTDNRSRKRIFVFDNGQIWAETERSRMQRHPRHGAQVTVSEETFGRFRLRVDGRRGYVDVRRVK